MNRERWQKIDALFDEVLDVAPNERDVFLEKTCLNDRELFAEVRKLLDAAALTADFIEKPRFIPAKNFLTENSDENFVGQKIGRYKIQKLLGRGGMCAVYLAARTDDYEKNVAVKLIPPFENKKESAENFRRERQILARLEHPSIAQILDGGTTAEGTPYLVMEYVDGVPLNQYCREKNLGLNEKLGIFQEVCRAVSFAHQNLIVHRDLKPNNILVKNDSTVKLLDFGIAKLLVSEDFGTGENKTFDGNALTLEYASPEQMTGENITTASDVYSLGVVLYELLTNIRPHSFRNKSLGEILKIMTTDEIKPPSAASEGKPVSAEIDAIVLKALCKRADDRYQTVEQFSADIDKYLNNKPITARPNTFSYRLEKYIARHRWEFAICVLVGFLVIGWLMTVVSQMQTAEKQARQNRRSAYSAEMILAADEYENANLPRLKQLVEKYIPQDGETDLRGFEWYFLNNLLNPPTKVDSRRLKDEVWSVEYSPDGNYIAAACNNNRTYLWNQKTGEILETAEQRGAWKVSFFPDSQKFAVASSSNSFPLIKIYETATAKELAVLKNHSKRIRAIDISADGKLLASGSQDGRILIWDAEKGTVLKEFSFEMSNKGVEIYDVQFSRDGTRLAALGFETLVIFNTKDWSKKQIDNEYVMEKNAFLNGWKLAFSPLQKTLAIATFNGDVIFLDTDTLEIIRVLRIHQSNVKSLAFSPDGKVLVTGSGDRSIKFVDVQTGEVTQELRGHFAGVHEVAFSPDGSRIASSSGDFFVNIWNYEKLLNSNSILMNAMYLAFSENAETASIWSVPSAEFSSWNLPEKRKILSVKSDVKPFSMTEHSRKNLIAFGEREGFVAIFEMTTGKILKRFKIADKGIYAVSFSPNGEKLFAATEDGILKAFSVESGAEIFAVKAHADIIKAIAVSPDGKYVVTGGNDKLVKFFEAESGAEVSVFRDHTKPLYKIVFSPDGKYWISTGADDFANVRKTETQEIAHEISGMSGGVYTAEFSPDGRRLATASDIGIVRLWDMETGAQVLSFNASQKQVNYLKFTSDGKTLMSLDANGKLSIWNAK